MKPHYQIARLISAALLSLGIFATAAVATTTPARAAEPPITLAQLAGPWAMTLTGDTGCGITTLYVTFTLNTSGSGSATYVSHTSGCGDGRTTGVPFSIQSLNGNGSGTANLSCGSGCGWNLNIQVAHNRQIFNAVDVSSANPGNFMEGSAIHQ